MTGPDLATHPIHRIAPVGDPYVLGRWHQDRLTWKGYSLEARVFLKSLVRRNGTQRFLVLGRPRSGTTLLQRLLNQIEGIHCDNEMLHHAVLDPRGFLNRLAGIKSSHSWGCKILSYQMLEVQRIPDHRAFLEGLKDDGFHLIHIRRGTYAQSLSLSVAQTVKEYHIRKGGNGEGGGAVRHLSLDPDRFVAQLRWNLAMLDYEERLLAGLPHMTVTYEADLESPAFHQSAVDRICAGLGLPPMPVAADLARTGERRRVDNLEALHAAIRAAGLGHVLDDPST